MGFYGASAEVQFEVIATQKAAWEALEPKSQQDDIVLGWRAAVAARIPVPGTLDDLMHLACPAGIGDGLSDDETKAAIFSWLDNKVESVCQDLRQYTPPGPPRPGVITAVKATQDGGGWTSCGRGCHISHKDLKEVHGENQELISQVVIDIEYPLGSGTLWTGQVKLQYTAIQFS